MYSASSQGICDMNTPTYELSTLRTKYMLRLTLALGSPWGGPGEKDALSFRSPKMGLNRC